MHRCCCLISKFIDILNWSTLCPKKVSPLNILQQPPQTCIDLNEILHTQDDIYFCHRRLIPFTRRSILSNCCHKFQLLIQLTSCWRHLWWHVWRQCVLINKQHVIERGSSFNKNAESWKRYGAKRLMAEFPRRNWSLAAVTRLLQKIDATGSADLWVNVI